MEQRCLLGSSEEAGSLDSGSMRSGTLKVLGRAPISWTTRRG